MFSKVKVPSAALETVVSAGRVMPSAEPAMVKLNWFAAVAASPSRNFMPFSFSSALAVYLLVSLASMVWPALTVAVLAESISTV